MIRKQFADGTFAASARGRPRFSSVLSFSGADKQWKAQKSFSVKNLSAEREREKEGWKLYLQLNKALRNRSSYLFLHLLTSMSNRNN